MENVRWMFLFFFFHSYNMYEFTFYPLTSSCGFPKCFKWHDDRSKTQSVEDRLGKLVWVGVAKTSGPVWHQHSKADMSVHAHQNAALLHPTLSTCASVVQNQAPTPEKFISKCFTVTQLKYVTGSDLVIDEQMNQPRAFLQKKETIFKFNNTRTNTHKRYKVIQVE